MFHFGFPFFLVSVGFYFLPTIVGAARHKANLVGIFLVNFLLGWSIIGWIVALVWAVSTERVDQMTFAQPGSYAQPGPYAQPARRFCPSCGNDARMGAFCAHCGQAIQ